MDAGVSAVLAVRAPLWKAGLATSGGFQKGPPLAQLHRFTGSGTERFIRNSGLVVISLELPSASRIGWKLLSVLERPPVVRAETALESPGPAPMS